MCIEEFNEALIEWHLVSGQMNCISTHKWLAHSYALIAKSMQYAKEQYIH